MKNKDIYLIFIIIFLIIFAIVSLYFIIEFCLLIDSRKTYHQLINKELYETPILSSKQVKAPKTQKYLDQVNSGYKNAKNKKIIIASLCRNVKKSIEPTRTRLEKIGKAFGDYRIILFENDSADGTRKGLIRWTKENNRVILLDCCEFGPCDCKLKYKHGYDFGIVSTSRMEKMAFYRNQYLDYTKKYFGDFDYLCVYDFDLEGGIYLDGLISNFDPKLEWDMVCATGLMGFPSLGPPKNFNGIYDGLSYVGLNQDFYDKDISLSNQVLLMNKLCRKNIGEDLIQIKSGFNGMAIYKINSIKDLNYDFKTHCEHIDLHKNMFEKGFNKIFLSPNMVLYTVQQGPNTNISELIKYAYEILAANT